MMQLSLDLQSKTPIYVQIVEQVKHQVDTGALRPGDQLPTVREMAATLRINFNTVARAYRLLHDERVISTQQGRGTYVLEPSPSPAQERFPAPDNGRTRAWQRMVEGWLAEAERAGISPNEMDQLWHTCFAAWRATRTGANAGPESYQTETKE
jgi:GntR family transcriptional regulator